MALNNVTVCPKNKNTKPKGKKCKKCEFYNPKEWFSYNKRIEVFCEFDMNSRERGFLKNPLKALKEYKDNKVKKDKKVKPSILKRIFK